LALRRKKKRANRRVNDKQYPKWTLEQAGNRWGTSRGITSEYKERERLIMPFSCFLSNLKVSFYDKTPSYHIV
jgi:hypothetical protein